MGGNYKIPPDQPGPPILQAVLNSRSSKTTFLGVTIINRVPIIKFRSQKIPEFTVYYYYYYYYYYYHYYYYYYYYYCCYYY